MGPAPTIPSNAQNLIIVLGQCALPTGQPHPWLIDRVNTAFQIINITNGKIKEHQQGSMLNKIQSDKEKSAHKGKLEIQNTYFIVTGSDVSNREYNIAAKDGRHPSQAQMMSNLLIQKFKDAFSNKTQSSQQNKKEQKYYQSHILKQDQANTTIQNFYFAFTMISKSGLRNKIKEVYVVTSDFHAKRARYCFQTMFSANGQQIIGKKQNFVVSQNVHFVESPSVWKSQYQRGQKFEKQQSLYNSQFLRGQTVKTAQRLWKQVKERQNSVYYN